MDHLYNVSVLQFFACLVILFACEVAAGIWGFMHKDTVRLPTYSRVWNRHATLSPKVQKIPIKTNFCQLHFQIYFNMPLDWKVPTSSCESETQQLKFVVACKTSLSWLPTYTVYYLNPLLATVLALMYTITGDLKYLFFLTITHWLLKNTEAWRYLKVDLLKVNPLFLKES